MTDDEEQQRLVERVGCVRGSRCRCTRSSSPYRELTRPVLRVPRRARRREPRRHHHGRHPRVRHALEAALAAQPVGVRAQGPAALPAEHGRHVGAGADRRRSRGVGRSMTSQVMDAGPATDDSGGHDQDTGLAELVAMMPFAVGLGIELQAASAEEVTATMAWRDQLCTTFGALHGGAMMAMADSVGAVCGVPQPAGRCEHVDDRVEDELLPWPARGERSTPTSTAAARRAHDDRDPDRPPRRSRQAGRPGHADPGRSGEVT